MKNPNEKIDALLLSFGIHVCDIVTEDAGLGFYPTPDRMRLADRALATFTHDDTSLDSKRGECCNKNVPGCYCRTGGRPQSEMCQDCLPTRLQNEPDNTRDRCICPPKI